MAEIVETVEGENSGIGDQDWRHVGMAVGKAETGPEDLRETRQWSAVARRLHQLHGVERAALMCSKRQLVRPSFVPNSNILQQSDYQDAYDNCNTLSKIAVGFEESEQQDQNFVNFDFEQ